MQEGGRRDRRAQSGGVAPMLDISSCSRFLFKIPGHRPPMASLPTLSRSWIIAKASEVPSARRLLDLRPLGSPSPT